MNLSATHGVGSALATTVADTYFIPIPNPFSDSEVNLRGLDAPITVRLLASNNWLYSTSTGVIGDLDCTALQIYLEGEQHDSAVQMSLRKEVRNAEFRFIDNQFQSFSVPLVANTPSEVLLNSFRGPCAYMVVTVRPSSLTGENAINYQALKSFTLYDSDRAIVGSAQDGEYNRSIVAMAVPSELPLNQELYIINHALDISAAHAGQQTGYFLFSGNEILSVTLPVGASSATYTITVNAYMYSTLCIENGHFSVKN
jgi:hypothetical protein